MKNVFGWAAEYGGVFTTGQASVQGLSDEALTSAVASRAIRRLARGLYAVGAASDVGEERHAELCRGMLLLYPDAVLAGRSAVLAHGLPLWSVPLDLAMVQRDVVRQVNRSGAVIRPRSGEAGPTPSGPCTAPHAAVVQLALDDGSIQGVVAADAGLHRQLFTVDDLDREIDRHAGHRHVQRARAMRLLCDGGSESPGESRLRVILDSLGITVESQARITDGDTVVARADLRVAGTRILIEFDGAVKYADAGVESLVREKRREDRLRRLGWTVIRFVWSDLDRPRMILALVRAAIAQDRAA